MVLQSEVRVLAEAVDWLTLGRLSVHWLEYLFLELWADLMLFLDTGSEERKRPSEMIPAFTHCGGRRGGGLTCPRTNVRHVDQRPRVLDQGLVVQGHARAEVLRVHRLVELCVRHRNGCLVLSWYRPEKPQLINNHTYTHTHAHSTKSLLQAPQTLPWVVPICLMPSLSSMSS